MIRELRQIFVLLSLATIVTGFAYPFALTQMGHTFFHEQATGSLLQKNGSIIGSSLIGQEFTSEIYFHGRPSMIAGGYDPMLSSGSNLAPSDTKLALDVVKNIAALEQRGHVGSPPLDLITRSASGLDPEISVIAARYQATHIATARSLPLANVEHLIKSHMIAPTFGFLGKERLNVLQLNLALDNLASSPTDLSAPTGTP